MDRDVRIDAGFEQCDDGVNSGAYNTCNPDCTWPARCGDAVVDGDFGETCDDGVNDNSYGGCLSDCTSAPACGDTVINGDFGEVCDDGTNDGSYGTCRPNCQPAPYCGDGVVSSALGGEACDGSAFGGRTCSDLDGDGLWEPGDFDGGTLACDAACALDTSGCYVCGDGTRNGLESCDGVGLCGVSADCGGQDCSDLGFPPTTGLACNIDCTFDLSGCDTSTCGNNVIDGDEACDGDQLGGKACDDLDGDGDTGEAGDFDGGTLVCSGECTLDTTGCEWCGDGIVNGSEVCDGQDTAGTDCTTLGYPGGVLGCSPTCDAVDVSGCWECTDCSDCAGQACVDHRCGDCAVDSDCCAPFLCIGGTCTLPG
jgi:hypothetical protein